MYQGRELLDVINSKIIDYRDTVVANCDLDFFANISDKIGDVEARLVIRKIHDYIDGNVSGIVLNYQDDEFQVIYMGQEIETCFAEIESLRISIRKEKFVSEESIYHNVRISFSCGMAYKSSCAEELLKSSEIALAIAKKEGRNRTCIYENGKLFRSFDKTNIVYTKIGGNLRGSSQDGQKISHAKIREPYGVCVGLGNELFFVDRGNHSIKCITSKNVIRNIAGNGACGYGGDGGKAVDAMLNKPSGCAIDKEGNIYIADTGNNCIRKINELGIISTFWGNGITGVNSNHDDLNMVRLSRPGGVYVDDEMNVYTNDYGNNRIIKISKKGILLNIWGEERYGLIDGKSDACIFDRPYGVTVDLDRVYIPDYGNKAIRMIDQNEGICTTVFNYAAFPSLYENAEPYWVTVLKHRFLIIADGGNHCIIFWDMKENKMVCKMGEEKGYIDAKTDISDVRFCIPAGIVVDRDDETIYVADYANNAIRGIRVALFFNI